MPTTNFDPLLSVAISRAHGHPRRAILEGDGRPPSAAGLGPDDVTPVIHLNGYWWGSGTHHTGMELSAPRPQLGASLARLLNERLVVVVGYGGWDLVITREPLPKSIHGGLGFGEVHGSDPTASPELLCHGLPGR